MTNARGADLTVVILTFNEALHINRAIASLSGVANRIVVVDSFSTDGTQQMARDAGAEVVEHAFINQAKQFNWALDHLTIDTGWTMRLDADETVDPELGEEIVRRLGLLPPSVTGVTLDRRHVFMGRWIRWGGRFPLRMLRIWRTGQGRVEDIWMDEHVTVGGGDVIHFRHQFSDHNLNDLTFFTRKHNGYATREAAQVVMDRHRLVFGQEVAPRLTRQARAKRLLKQGIYNRIPFPISATGYFLFRYVVQMGFLDGLPGLIYHILQGFWYRFLVGAKTVEIERALPSGRDRMAKLAALRSLTRLDL